MGVFDTTVADRVAVMRQQQAQAFDFLVALIQSQAAEVYADPATASAYVAAMGTNAVAIFTLSATFAGAINAVAPVVGKPTIAVQPSGYTFTPAADGSATLTYVAPPTNAGEPTT